MKRIAAILLALLLIAALCPMALAEDETVVIRTAEELRAFAENCALESYSKDRTFSLEADLDLEGYDFAPIPYFTGVFLGNGHRIEGLAVGGEGSQRGLFRRIAEGAEIRDLTVSGRVTPEGTRQDVGGLAGVNAGLLENCAFSGTVTGLENVGGLIGTNEEGGRVINCRFEGEVRAEHQVGGLAGVNRGLLEGCLNRGSVNHARITPEREKNFNIAAFTEDDFLDLANIGGIAGDNAGTIRACENEGTVGYARTGYNVGGIAGRSAGYVTACENRGSVQGRRDAGGVVGQLIPHTVWDFSRDKLEDLSGELDRLDAMLDAVTGGAAARMQSLREQADAMRASVAETRDALAGVLSYYTGGIETLDPIALIGQEGLDGPDLSGLTAALEKLQLQSKAFSAELGADLEALPQELAAVQTQLKRVRESVSAVLGGLADEQLIESFDLSADESYEHELGAVDGCVNRGRVEADSSAGGVAGSMAFELSFDSEDSLRAADFLGTSVKRYLFAVLRGCESGAAVSVREDEAGGIVGRCESGAVVDCVAAGAVSSAKGDYVGGVAGSSDGTIRACVTRVELAGGKYVGGIAGSGAAIRDCAAWASVTRAAEAVGAVAGWAAGEVSGNRYVAGPPAGVDGVSLTGACEPVTAEEFLALDGVPKSFGLLELRFEVEGRVIETREIPFGGTVGALPEVENDGARWWKWDEIADGPVYSDRTITGRYLAPLTVLATVEEPPLCLAEGQFYEGQSLRLLPWDGALPEGGILAAGTVEVAGYAGALTVHLRAAGGGRLCRVEADGSLTEIEYEVDRSYLVFPLENGGRFVVFAPEGRPRLPWLLGGAGALALVGAVLLLRRRKKRKGKSKK